MLGINLSDEVSMSFLQFRKFRNMKSTRNGLMLMNSWLIIVDHFLFLLLKYSILSYLANSLLDCLTLLWRGQHFKCHLRIKNIS